MQVSNSAVSRPVSFVSVLIQVSAGLPCFLCPCRGVHRTTLETISFSLLLEWPASISLLLLILSESLGRLPQSSSFVRNWSHLMPNAVLSSRVQQPSICLVSFSVRVQASLPQSRMDSTALPSSLTLISLDRSDFQTFVNLLHALHASAFLLLRSASVLSIQEPRYLKSYTTSSWVPSVVMIFTSSLWLQAITLVFFAFIDRPICAADVSTRFRRSWAWLISSESRAMSSAKSRSVITTGKSRQCCYTIRILTKENLQVIKRAMMNLIYCFPDHPDTFSVAKYRKPC